jgi:hypothetical protein
MKRIFYPYLPVGFLLWVMIVSVSQGQVLNKSLLRRSEKSGSGPTSNGINDIKILEEDVWIAAGRGLSRTTDDGQTWTQYTRADGMGRGGISALAVNQDMIWVATVFDTLTDLGENIAGGGLSYSTDRGESWHWLPQPIDSSDVTEYLPVHTVVNNTTWDIALTDSAIWIASWAGGLRKSTNMGETWQVVTVDGLPFNVSNNNYIHMGFSIISDGEALWAGSAGGVHKSTDGGRTWTTFSHQNQPHPISGNFVVAIGNQALGDRNIIWAATNEAVDTTEYRAVSKSEDGGLTWIVCLEGEFAHNFAFDDSVVYVATDNGLYKSVDFGETWAVFPQIYDHDTGESIYTSEVNSAGMGPNHTLWVGTSDGLARTRDNGTTWKIFRTFLEPGKVGTPETYAYPNPFSPLRHNVIGGDGHVRFQYQTARTTTVSVRVYDFGMNLVKTVADGKSRPLPGDYAEVWDGKNEIGEMVANGVYFYQITLSGGKTLWGKVMVVN